MFFSLLFGTGGVIQYFQLQEYYNMLKENIGELQIINNELAIDLRDLSSNPDTIRQKARKLGYYSAGEQVIRIEGVTTGTPAKQIGSLLRRSHNSKMPNPVFHIIGIAVSICVFGLLSYLKKKRSL